MKKLLGVILLACMCTTVCAREISQVCANHILVPTELDAIKIKSQIKTFEDFSKYAKLYSTCPSGQRGGDLGCFGRGVMVKPFENAAFDGRVNEVSDPIKTQFGYHLIWVTRQF